MKISCWNVTASCGLIVLIMCGVEAGRSTWHLLVTCSVWGFHQNPGQERCLWYQAENINSWQLRCTDGIKENAVYRVPNTLGSACPERRRRAGPSMQISCQLLRTELTGWMDEDVTCMFMILNKASVRQPQGSAFHIISAPATSLFFACICSAFARLKGACLFHMVLYKLVVFILQVNQSNKSLILNGLTEKLQFSNSLSCKHQG